MNLKNYKNPNVNAVVKAPVRHKEVTLVGNGKLLLSEELVNKIHLIHLKVARNMEWSGILRYKIESGSIEDPANLVILAEDFLLMDIGSSAYTEYDFDTSDNTVVDFILDAQLNGSKYGHLHSHHSMKCYFSGTDMGELHDNAPNHDVYLSLIVNYEMEASSNWCAKICFITKDVKKGTRKISNNISWSRYLSGSLNPFNSEVNDKSEEEEINEEFTSLNMINLDIEEKQSESYQKLLSRFTEIKPKPITLDHYKGVGYNNFGDSYDDSPFGYKSSYPKNGYVPSYFPKGMTKSTSKKANTNSIQKTIDFNELAEMEDAGVMTPSIIFSQEKIEATILSIFNALPSLRGNKIKDMDALSAYKFFKYHYAQLEGYLRENFDKVLDKDYDLKLDNLHDETYLHLFGAKLMEVLEYYFDNEEIIDIFEAHTESLVDWDLMGPVQTGMLLGD